MREEPAIATLKYGNRFAHAVTLPEFNTIQDPTELDRHVERFNVELIRCVRKDNRISIPPKLNILLLIADPKNAKQMKSWNGVQKFLKTSGYDVERVRMTAPREADLLFICTDRDQDEDVTYLVSTISQGLFGLVPKHEVLVSCPVRYIPYGIEPHLPMLLGPNFMAYGICMVHEYIRTLHDNSAKVGRHVAMMLQLEGTLQRHGVVQSNDDTDAHDKIEAFKSLLKSRKHDGGEARWVFAVLDPAATHAQHHRPHAAAPQCDTRL